jgi:hypothetical protein
MVFVVRLFVSLGLIVIALSLLTFLVTRDRRYLRFAWQLLKFSLVFLLVLGAVLAMGRLILA